MKPLLLFILLTLTACVKEPLTAKKLSANREHSTAITDTITIPIIDMGTNTYRGFKGGLYPDGSNLPSGTYADDLLSVVSSIKPLDTGGIRNNTTGKIGFIGVGASTCSIMIKALKGKTDGNPLTNPKLVLAPCTSGGISVNEIMDPANRFWYVVKRKLSDAALTANQVEVIYMETDDSVQNNPFPERPLRTKVEFEQAMRTFKVKFPNIKLVYLLGRTSAFIKERPDKITNTEPTPYYNGWACKWVIEDQINGVSGTEYKGAGAVAPLVTWGWYEWGNAVPRSDGFTWTKDNTRDGLHANDAGADTLATRFQNFLLTDKYANVWYANHAQ
jgi:hypothetical protein